MGKHRILAIDDERDILSLLENLLGDEYEFVAMSDPIKALELLEEIEPDIFIIDIMMPRMSGHEVVRRLRRSPHYKQSPIIFFSVITDRQVIIESYKCGVDLFLTKPFTPDRLIDSLYAFLNRRIIPVRAKKNPLDELNAKLLKPSEPQIQAVEKKPVSGDITEKKASAKTQVVPAQSKSPEESSSSPPVHEKKAEEPTITTTLQPPSPPLTPSPMPEKRQIVQERKPGVLPRIMIADDDQELLASLSMSLGDKYELFTVSNGHEVIRQSEMIEPDIFIIDAMMPRLSGYQVCQVLLKSEHFATTPIVIISSKSSQKDIKYVKKLGAKAFIAKPFNFMQLDNAIIKILQDPYFEIRPKLYTREEILKIKEIEALSKEEKEKERLHRETKNIMKDFVHHIIVEKTPPSGK
jgi:DNA-binding response OmpR family regulator